MLNQLDSSENTALQIIAGSLIRLENYCNRCNFEGWDVFDGLKSPLFKNDRLFSSRLPRLAWIQLFKKSPINLRQLAGVPKGCNAKGLALFASGILARGRTEQAQRLLDRLSLMVCSDFGVSWGYDFPWQARAFYVPTGVPNMIATVFAGNALLDSFEKTHSESHLALAEESCEFILTHLIVSEDRQSLCFGYIPGNPTIVHNVNMLGAAFLARVYSITGKAVLIDKSLKAMRYSINALSSEYLWPYGELPHHRFIDNFHTGFNLTALHDWMVFSVDNRWRQELCSAFEQYTNLFWLANGCPKYYHNSLYPIDIHCSAQGIITFLKIAPFDKVCLSNARRIALWAIMNMQDKEGYFYYQKTKWFLNKIPYIRWSQGWMFLALSLLIGMESSSKIGVRTL